MEDFNDVLAAVGPRLRALRRQRGRTLANLAETVGVSESTLSRLESGQRQPTLQLLLPLARAYGVPLDDLVGAPRMGDPRIHLKPVNRFGMTFIPLIHGAGGIQAYKMIIPGRANPMAPERQTHEGFQWLYVLSGRLRLLLGDQDLVLPAGEVAEYDTAIPHVLDTADGKLVEVLILFGQQGERARTRVRPDGDR